MEKKLTKKQMFEKVLVLVEGNQDLVDFVNHEIELLDRKASRSTETKIQKENVAIKTAIVNALANIGKPVTISELQDSDETMASYSNQKLSALLKQLVEENQVNKVTEKKKSYFSIAE